jgi:hypothetical protein
MERGYSLPDERCCFGLRNGGDVFEIWNDVISWYGDFGLKQISDALKAMEVESALEILQ